MSHCFWRESGGIFCTFISEGRMLPTLKRLIPTTHKGKDYMIASNSFVFEFCNSAKNTFDLLATRSCTRSACLDLGGASNPFWKWRFEVPDMKPETAHVGPWHTQQPRSHTPADPTTEARTICSHATPAGGPAVAHDARQGAAATA